MAYWRIVSRSQNRKHATCAKHRLFGGLEQVIAPRDGRLQGLVAGWQVAMDGPDQGCSGIEPLQDGCRSEHTCLGGSQFDGQR
jgi:hypothetical protein